jgi:3-hydroxybutyryl-CoA dehydrogenase
MSSGQTSAASLATAAGLARRLGLQPVVLQGEITGFLYGRIWRAVKREAIAQLERGLATAEEIDLACRIGMNMPEGPLRMMDRIGLDVVLAIEEHYATESSDPRDTPPAVLRERVAAGHLGRKTGRGFYDDYGAD